MREDGRVYPGCIGWYIPRYIGWYIPGWYIPTMVYLRCHIPTMVYFRCHIPSTATLVVHTQHGYTGGTYPGVPQGVHTRVYLRVSIPGLTPEESDE